VNAGIDSRNEISTTSILRNSGRETNQPARKPRGGIPNSGGTTIGSSGETQPKEGVSGGGKMLRKREKGTRGVKGGAGAQRGNNHGGGGGANPKGKSLIGGDEKPGIGDSF